jgi:hypothetical protein
MAKQIEQVEKSTFIKNAVESAYNRAEKRDTKARREFDITPEYMEELWRIQGGRCAISNERMTRFEGHGKNSIIESNGSIDRIDSKKGYVKGNVQWVTWEVNRMKGRLDYDTLVHACDSVIRNVTYYGTILLPQIKACAI